MKDFMDFEEHKAMKEKRSRKMKSKEKGKDYEETDAMEIKKVKQKSGKVKSTGFRESDFKNNYKNFQYDYEEDFYDPDYR